MDKWISRLKEVKLSYVPIGRSSLELLECMVWRRLLTTNEKVWKTLWKTNARTAALSHTTLLFGAITNQLFTEGGKLLTYILKWYRERYFWNEEWDWSWVLILFAYVWWSHMCDKTTRRKTKSTTKSPLIFIKDNLIV